MQVSGEGIVEGDDMNDLCPLYHSRLLADDLDRQLRDRAEPTPAKTLMELARCRPNCKLYVGTTTSEGIGIFVCGLVSADLVKQV